MVTKQIFVRITNLVIKHIEGGYYHPNMLKNFNAASQKIMKASGETMFGLDRKHGIALSKYPEWNEFWKVIDDAGASTKWKHYYRGGALEPKLTELASAIMYPWFLGLCKKYISDAGTTAMINDERLLMNFSYASWNGTGWFKKFAAVLNNVASITKDKETILKAVIGARLNSGNKVIMQQVANLKAAMNEL